MYACPNLRNRGSSDRRVSMRRPRSSAITLSALVRTSLIMKANVSGGPIRWIAWIISGIARKVARAAGPGATPGRPRGRTSALRGCRLVPAPNQIEQDLHPATDPVQAGALGQLGAGGGKKAAPELGRRAEIGPAQLPEEESRHPSGPRGHRQGRGEVDQVRLVAGTGQDVVSVQVAVRHATRVERADQLIEAIEELRIQLTRPEGGQAPPGHVLERDRLAVHPREERRCSGRAGQGAIGAFLAIELPRAQD